MLTNDAQGFVTAAQKLQRKVIIEKYKNQVKKAYGDE
jgi:long-subunit acyl-CoA synthetase (AMP-forming)